MTYEQLEKMAEACFYTYVTELRAWSAEQERLRAEKDAEIARMREELEYLRAYKRGRDILKGRAERFTGPVEWDGPEIIGTWP